MTLPRDLCVILAKVQAIKTGVTLIKTESVSGLSVDWHNILCKIEVHNTWILLRDKLMLLRWEMWKSKCTYCYDTVLLWKSQKKKFLNLNSLLKYISLGFWLLLYWKRGNWKKTHLLKICNCWKKNKCWHLDVFFE